MNEVYCRKRCCLKFMQDGSLCLYFEKGYYPGLKILSDFCDTIGRGEGTVKKNSANDFGKFLSRLGPFSIPPTFLATEHSIVLADRTCRKFQSKPSPEICCSNWDPFSYILFFSDKVFFFYLKLMVVLFSKIFST